MDDYDDTTNGFAVFVILYIVATCFTIWKFHDDDQNNITRLHNELREARRIALEGENPAESIYENV